MTNTGNSVFLQYKSHATNDQQVLVAYIMFSILHHVQHLTSCLAARLLLKWSTGTHFTHVATPKGCGKNGFLRVLLTFVNSNSKFFHRNWAQVFLYGLHPMIIWDWFHFKGSYEKWLYFSSWSYRSRSRRSCRSMKQLTFKVVRAVLFSANFFIRSSTVPQRNQRGYVTSLCRCTHNHW